MRAFAIIAAVILGYFAYTSAFPSGTLRYRLTVEVMVDGEVHSGSSVIEARFTKQRAWDNSVIGKAKGEAVVVGLGAQGLLFVLLSAAPPSQTGAEYAANATSMPIREFGLAPSIGSLDEATLRSLRQLDAQAEIAPANLPLFVRFRNLSDPQSAQRVDPRNLATTYGPGSRLVRVVIETTDDQVTRGIEQRLPWLADYEKTTEAWQAIIRGIKWWGATEPTTLFTIG